MKPRVAERPEGRTGPREGCTDRAARFPVEWPTIWVAAGTYAGLGLLTWFYHALPWWVVLPVAGYLVCLHGSLQHEAVHCHPTRRPWLNELMIFPSLWLWLPFRIYRETHTRHHETAALTHPLADPESDDVSDPVWRTMNVVARACYWTRNSLLGRLLLGPLEAVWMTFREELLLLMRGDHRHLGHLAVHLAAVALVLVWVMGVCEIPLAEFILLFAYPGLSFTLLRSFLEHRADPDPAQRSVVVEAGALFSLLFLNNNLHALHHAEPQLAWYRLPARYRQERVRLLNQNGGYRFTGYLEIFTRYLVKAKEMPCHPGPVPV